MTPEIKKVINRFKRKHPKEVCDIMRDCRVSLTYLGRGSFRRVYQINDLPLVVKVATENHDDGTDYGECVDHNQNELDAIKQVQKKRHYAPLRKYLPTVYYHNDSIIVMHKYKQTGLYINHKLCQKAADEITEIMGTELDLYKNFSINENGKIILIDWGVLGSLSYWKQS